MSEQPEALRLIQHMDEEYPEDWDGSAIRDELRRQHSEIEQLKAERDALLADAERYRYLRIHCYRYRWPNNEHDRAMHLSFTVSGIWANNHDPEVLDGCIDTAREEKK